MYKGLNSNTFEWSEIGKITLGVSEGFGAMGIVSAIAWGLDISVSRISLQDLWP